MAADSDKFEVSRLELYYIIIAHVRHSENETIQNNPHVRDFRARLINHVKDKSNLSDMYLRLFHNTQSRLAKLCDLKGVRIEDFAGECSKFCKDNAEQFNKDLELVRTSNTEINTEGTVVEEGVCHGKNDMDLLQFDTVEKCTKCDPIDRKCDHEMIMGCAKTTFNIGWGNEKGDEKYNGRCMTKMPSLYKLHGDEGKALVWDKEVKGRCGPMVSRYIKETSDPIVDHFSNYAHWAWDDPKDPRYTPRFQVYISALKPNVLMNFNADAGSISTFDEDYDGHFAGVITIKVTENAIRQFFVETFLTKSRILFFEEQETNDEVRIFCNEVVALAPIMHESDIPGPGDPKVCFYQTLALEGFANMSRPGVAPLGHVRNHVLSPAFSRERNVARRPSMARTALQYSYWVAIALLLCILFIKMYMRGA